MRSPLPVIVALMSTSLMLKLSPTPPRAPTFLVPVTLTVTETVLILMMPPLTEPNNAPTEVFPVTLARSPAIEKF